MRKLLLILLLPVLAFLSMGAALQPTSATHPSAAASVLSSAVVHTAFDDCSKATCPGGSPLERDAAFSAILYLPTNRWSKMEFHSRLNWWEPVQAANASASRAAAGGAMNGGNAIWQLASEVSRSAMDFKPLNTALGFQVDRISGVIGKAITGQPVLFALIITFLLVVVLWRAMRRPGTRPFGRLLQAAIVFSLVTMMGTQAAAGTVGDPPSTYTPKAGSPVWLANAVTGTVDNMASVAVAAVMDGMLPVLTSASGTAPGPGWSCAALIDGSFRAAKTAKPTAGAEAVNRSMNAMWISTAYTVYTVAQFGDSNPYGKEVACRQLERETTAGAWTRSRMLSQSLYQTLTDVPLADPSKTSPFKSMNVPMLQSTSDNEANDAAMVAWAACAPSDLAGTTFTVRTGWSDWITAQNCKDAFSATKPDELKNIGSGAFNRADDDAVREKTDNPDVLNFVSTLHGREPGIALGSITSTIVFFIGALVAAGIFGLMALAVFGSKIFMLLMVAMMFILLVISLFKNEGFGDTMRQPASRFLGVTIFAFGSTMLLTILATFSLIISSLSSLFGAAGAIGPMLWVSFSPLLATIAVHYLFTKVLKMPSPMTAKGALAWGTAGGAVGGAVGAGLVNRMQNRAGAAARGLGRKALSSNKYTSWMVRGGNGASAARKGSGDAGSRNAENTRLGEDLTSQDLGARSGLSTGPGGAAAASAEAVAEATKHLSKDSRKELARDARRQWKAENPGALRTRMDAFKNNLTARQDARAGALAAAMGEGADFDENAMLSSAARGKVSLINRPSMDDFLLSPGDAVSAISAAKWADLSAEGKLAATKLAAAKARESRQVEKTARAHQAQLRRDARDAATAQLPPLSDRAKAAARAGVNSVRSGVNASGAAANAAWAEAKTRSLEFAANPAGVSASAARASVDAARKASHLSVDAARKTAAAAVNGAGRVRQAAASTVGSPKGRAIATGVAVAAGVALAPMGAPVVGGLVVAAAAKNVHKRHTLRQQAKQTQINDIIVARAAARKTGTPGTSTVSDAAPVTTDMQA